MMNYDFLRSDIQSIKFIDDANHQIEQLQRWMWWEDHAVLRNILILLLLLFITGGLLLLSFLMRRNMILSFVFVPLTVIFFVFTVFIIFADGGLRTPIHSSNTYIAKYLAPHEYKHQLNLQKESIERKEEAAQIENKWDNAKEQKAVVQNIKFDNHDENLKIKINNQWYTESDKTIEYVENHVDKGTEIKYKKLDDEIWVLGFKS